MSGLSFIKKETSPSQGRKKDDSEKRPNEPRKYARITAESIKMMSEAAGILGCTEEIANKISEDVTYRIRELLHHANIFLRHSNRRKLLTTDIEEALEDYDFPPLYGHSFSKRLDMLHIDEADVFVLDDEEEDVVEQAFEDTELVQLGDPVIQDYKVAPTVVEVAPLPEPQATIKQEETTSCAPASMSEPSTSSGPSTSAASFPTAFGEASSASAFGEAASSSSATTSSEESSKPTLAPYLLTYYEQVGSVILGNTKTHFDIVMADFLINSKIGTVVPYLFNLIAMSLQKLPTKRHQLLHTVLVLTFNPTIELSCSLSVHRLVSALLLCALESKSFEEIPISDEYEVRSVAAVVLSRVVGEWCQGENKLQLDIVQKLGTVILNGSSPLKSHYGALACLVGLGCDALDYCLWPHLPEYLSFLEMKPADEGVVEVHGAILDAAEDLYRAEWATMLDPSTPPQGIVSIMMVYSALESYFGDALCARWPIRRISNIDNHSADTGKFSMIYSKRSFHIFGKNNSSRLLDIDDSTNTEKGKKFPLYSRKQGKFVPIANSAQVTRKYSVSEVFDLSVPRSKLKKSIQMKFAGGNPVPRDCLVRRGLDKNHRQFTTPSLYAAKSYRIECAALRKFVLRKKVGWTFEHPGNEELLMVL